MTGTLSSSGALRLRLSGTVNGQTRVADQYNGTLSNQNGLTGGSGQISDTDPLPGDPSNIGTFTVVKL